MHGRQLLQMGIDGLPRAEKGILIMTTVRYARFVLVDEELGSVVWYDNRKEAEEAQNLNGGRLYDADVDDPHELDMALRNARKNMGVE